MAPLTQREMDRLTRDLRTKADKIRALARAGAGPSEISKFLEIRYQHAYNVLKRSGLSPSGNVVRDSPPRSGSGLPKAVLDASGHIVLPERVLEAWSASPGDELLVRLEGDELRVVTREAGLRLARDVLRSYPRHGEPMADELLAERRREAKRNDD